jgi:hypothetical protein
MPNAGEDGRTNSCHTRTSSISHCGSNAYLIGSNHSPGCVEGPNAWMDIGPVEQRSRFQTRTCFEMGRSFRNELVGSNNDLFERSP